MTRFLSTAFTFCMLATATFAQPLHPCAELIWQDEFDGSTLDATKWTPQIGDGCDINLCGWGNDEAQYYTGRTENVKVDAGNLVITSLKESMGTRDYTSARIRTLNKGDFTFGRIEARMKLPKGAGSWPAFWMLSSDETYGAWPQSGEIDIMEYQGKDPNAVSGTVHYGELPPNNKYKGLVYRLPSEGNFYDDFHVFTLEWDSTAIKWYMDGDLYHTFTPTDAIPYNWPFDQRFHIILNNAVGGYLGGPIDDASFPMVTTVDYVRVYTSPLNFHIAGKQHLFINTSNVIYSVPTISGASSYNWSVPSGATIVSGQNSNQIAVNWGGVSSQGNVVLEVVKSCGTTQLTLPVTLVDDNACEIILDDMNGNTNVSYDDWTTNTFLASRSNPSATGINTSSNVGIIRKTALVATNKFVLGNLPIGDFNDYESGQRILYMDVYSTADPGTTVELRLQNKTKAHNGTYPAGVRSVLKAKTTFNRKWETLVFKLDRTEDLTTLINEINQIAVVFNPEENQTGIALYFDNIKRKKIPYNAISGNETPSACNLTDQLYTVSNTGSYTWTVPAGTSITSGQSSNTIHVNWGSVRSGKIYLTETIAGCTGYSASLDVTAANCVTGILEGEGNLQSLTLYPNPSRDQLTVTCDLPSPSDVKLIISSSLGETLVIKNYSGQSGIFKEQFSIQELKPGSYIIQLLTGSDIHASQLIKY